MTDPFVYDAKAHEEGRLILDPVAIIRCPWCGGPAAELYWRRIGAYQSGEYEILFYGDEPDALPHLRRLVGIEPSQTSQGGRRWCSQPVEHRWAAGPRDEGRVRAFVDAGHHRSGEQLNLQARRMGHVSR